LFIYCAEWSAKVLIEKLYAHIGIEDLGVFEYFEKYLASVKTMKDDYELILFLKGLEKETAPQGRVKEGVYGTGMGYGNMLIQNSKRKGTIRTDIDDDLLMEYFISISERFGQRCIAKYWDFVSDLTPERELSLNREMAQMIDLIKKGWGVSMFSFSALLHMSS
jgi:hypothetical protein